MVRFNGVNHLAFATGDMDKTVRFWRDLLGMRLVATIGEPGFRHYFFELSETDTVAFFEWDGVEAAPEKRHGVPEKGPFIFDHVSFGVDSADDLWELKKLVVWITLVLRCRVLIRLGRFLRVRWVQHSALSKRHAMASFGLQFLI